MTTTTPTTGRQDETTIEPRTFIRVWLNDAAPACAVTADRIRRDYEHDAYSGDDTSRDYRLYEPHPDGSLTEVKVQHVGGRKDSEERYGYDEYWIVAVGTDVVRAVFTMAINLDF